MTPSVLVLDTSILSAELVANYLAQYGSIQIVGFADRSDDAAELLLHHRPEVVLLDRVPASVADLSLLHAARAVRSALILHGATSPQQSMSELAMLGIRAVVLKEVRRLDDLVAAVHRVAASEDSRPSISEG